MRRLALLLVLAGLLAGSAAAATIRGTALGELLRGTPGPDRIAAGAGNDRVDVAFGGSDTVACGPGSDLVVADRGDRVGRDCETVVRRLSSDPFGNPSSQHETAVEPDSAAWGSTVVAAFQVGRFRSGGASGIGFAVSRDAGLTWSSGRLPQLTVDSTPAGTQSRVSDPAVAYDAVHGTWLVASLGITSATSVLVSRSADGLGWSAPVDLADGPLLDKEWIACDNGAASPFLGRCYVFYTDDALHQISLQTSTDGGVTWSAPGRVSTDLLGAQPLVRPDGSLVVLAADLPQGDQGAIVALRSSDGGATFTGSTVANFVWHQPDRMRAVPLPSGAVGPDGRVYAAWQQCPADGDCRANEVVVARSDDGSVWGSALAATSAATDHFVVGLAADPGRQGRLALVYDLFQPGSCGSRSGCLVGTAFTSSSDGGDTWTPPLRLDASPAAESSLADAEGRMVGDYFSTDFAGGRAVPVFALAEPPLDGRLREAIFAASLPVR